MIPKDSLGAGEGYPFSSFYCSYNCDSGTFYKQHRYVQSGFISFLFLWCLVWPP